MFKLNRNRSYRYPVTAVVHEGEREIKGQFHATFRAASGEEMRARGEEPLLDLVLLGLEGIEIEDDAGRPLEGDALLAAAKNDPAVSAALIAAYRESIVRKKPAENLIGAARRWLEGGRAERDELAALGIPAERASGDYEVWPENWPAVQVFAACTTQWRRAGLEARRCGLDYGAVEAVMRMLDVEDVPDTFWRVRKLEAEVLERLSPPRST